MHSWDNMSLLLLESSKAKSPPPAPPPPPPPPTTRSRFATLNSTMSNASSTSSLESSDSEELQRLDQAPSFWKNKKKLSKQLSMCETPRDVAWERRRRQILKQEKRKSMVLDSEDLTDEDLHELKGSIELGFGFSEDETGQKLCNTLPALDLYFAVNRQLSPSPGSTPQSNGSTSSMGARSSSFESPKSEDSWKICSPGDNPQQVKMRLRHWAQAVACSVMQSF
ncbi:Low-density lipoprotein receptor-related protein 2 [Bienertia sinuspersici]